eukprot:1290563-Pleurochrysis_carterae.AAC.1
MVEAQTAGQAPVYASLTAGWRGVVRCQSPRAAAASRARWRRRRTLAARGCSSRMSTASSNAPPSKGVLQAKASRKSTHAKPTSTSSPVCGRARDVRVRTCVCEFAYVFALVRLFVR